MYALCGDVGRQYCISPLHVLIVVHLTLDSISSFIPSFLLFLSMLSMVLETKVRHLKLMVSGDILKIKIPKKDVAGGIRSLAPHPPNSMCTTNTSLYLRYLQNDTLFTVCILSVALLLTPLLLLLILDRPFVEVNAKHIFVSKELLDYLEHAEEQAREPHAEVTVESLRHCT